MSSGPVDRPLRRSLFFVPGGEDRKLAKARSIRADTLLLDLEDSVAPPEKDRARSLVAATLREGGFGDSEAGVRVNPPGTPYFEDDLEAVVSAGAAAIMLPKSQSQKRLAEVARRIEAIEVRSKGPSGRVRLLALVETAAGISQAPTLGQASERVDALCLGHADLSRDLGLARADASRGVVLHARCALSIAAHASALAPIDTVYLDVRDAEGFRRDAEHGLELGFEGKLCIHPAQVEIANDVYTPAPEQIEYARRVIEASRQAEAEGKGVFTVDGKMVDSPLVAAQTRVLERARRAGAFTEAGGE